MPQFIGIFEHRDRHFEVMRARTLRIRHERLRLRSLEAMTGLVIRLEIQHITREQAKEQLAGVQPHAAKHAARLDLARMRQLIKRKLAKAIADAQTLSELTRLLARRLLRGCLRGLLDGFLHWHVGSSPS